MKSHRQKKIGIAVVGSQGRMGQEILEVIKSESSTLKLTGEVTVSRSMDKLNSDEVDVVIDFSTLEQLSKTCQWCAKSGRPAVIGTTGLSTPDQKKIKKASEKIAILWAPNMSLGVALLNELIPHLAKLTSFDFQIEEFHHRHKKDAPSGTAVFLQKTLKEALAPQKIPEPVSIRGGGIFGIHRVLAMSEEETITIEHAALNRRVFARGAVNVAKWIVDQKPGLYSLRDYLNDSVR